ncbi:hypothetical protein PspLS_05573 [Pyricularia sp. CBS 133598]|nr:hypothetical protein PspLS_05573 [Pyricularia sp. CBS 133598]
MRVTKGDLCQPVTNSSSSKVPYLTRKSDRFIGYEQGVAHAGIWSRLIHSQATTTSEKSIQYNSDPGIVHYNDFTAEQIIVQQVIKESVVTR